MTMTSTQDTATPSLGLDVIQLPCGIELVYKFSPESPRQALFMTFHGGNRVEAIPGLADLVDGLLTQGTAQRSAEDIAIAIDSIPMDLDIDTTRDYTGVSAVFMPEDTAAASALLGEVLFTSTLADWEREKVKTRGEIAMQLDSPATLARDMLSDALYENLPYKATLQSILQSLEAIQSQEQLLAHYHRVYHPNNCRVVAVGPLTKEAVLDALERVVSFYKPAASGTPVSLLDENKITQGAVIASDRTITAERNDSQQMHIVQGWFAPSYTHEDFPAMVVMNTVLGGAGLSSRLFTEIRDKQGLAYNVRSALDATRYIGLFTLYIGTEPKNRERALAGFAEECRKLREIPLTSTELNDAIENVLGRHVIYLERASQQAIYWGSKMAYGGTLDHLQAYRDRIQSVTIERVQEVSQRYLSQPSIISAVGPATFL